MQVKSILKKAVSDVIYKINPFGIPHIEAGSFRVLNYHSITDELVKDEYGQMTTPKSIFNDQMRFLSDNGYNVLSCGKLVEILFQQKPIPEKAICITFDDGFKDNLRNAAPILENYGYCATIFITTDFIGKEQCYLTWDELCSLKQSARFDVGSHTCTHRKLAVLDHVEIDKEIETSKKVLEDRLKTAVDLFAYPFGSYDSFNEDTVNALKAKGYKAAFANIAGTNTSATDIFRLKRTRISWYDDIKEFRKELLGAYDWYSLWQRISKAP